MNDEKKNDALESFLERDTKKDNNKKDEKKKKSKLKWIIIGAIALVLVIGVIVLLNVIPKNNDDEVLEECAEITNSVDDKKIHQVDVKLDENGKILQNGDGKFTDKVPSDIKQIDLENDGGNLTILSETPKATDESGNEVTDTTKYTVKGFEDLELQSGVADSIANACSNMSFIKVISVDGNLKDYGLEKPKATAKCTYTDNTISIIKVGNEAPQNKGTYISFGTKDTVYLVETDTVKSLLNTILDLINLSVTDSAEDTNANDLLSLTLSGSAYDNDITMKKNDDEAIKSSYKITSPKEFFPNETESSSIAGGLRGIYATKVVCVNPDENDLEKFSLSNVYAQAKANYKDKSFDIIASKPDSDDNVYLMLNGGKIIYQIGSSSVLWVKTSLEKLKPQVVLSPNKEKINSITVNDTDGTFEFKLETTTENVDNENGETEEVTKTNASYDGKTLNYDDFNTFFQNLDSLSITGDADNVPLSTPNITITFSYNTDRKDDTIELYKVNDKNIAVLNKETLGTIKKTYIDDFTKSVNNLISGKTVSSM